MSPSTQSPEIFRQRSYRISRGSGSGSELWVIRYIS